MTTTHPGQGAAEPQAIMHGAPEGCRYTIEHRGGCVLIFGAIPISAMRVLAGLAPRGAVLATDLARMAEANFAFGTVKDVQALVQELRPLAVFRMGKKLSGQDLPAGAVEWLAIGERGTSSNTMFEALTGCAAFEPGDTRRSHPQDPDDFRRCALLLQAVPDLNALLPKMRDVSAQWAALVDIWDELTDSLNSELERGVSGKGTLEMMDAALAKAAAAQRERATQ